MTRYVIKVGPECWVTAVYDNHSNGIGFTYKIEDAGSWVTIDKAAQAARVVSDRLRCSAFVTAVDEPDRPSSWDTAK